MTTIILHGYSDESASFKPLAKFLQANGVPVVTIHLGNYISLEDAVTIPDLAKAFGRALAQKKIPLGAGEIDLIVHSTGSLVAREWLTRYFLEPGLACPVRHYVMLAPANFGSPLAAMGKTMLGRVLKGWKSGFESGRQVLNALEMGSPYTRDLARRDLFGPRSFYDPAVCMTTVLVGSKPYQEGLRQIVDRNGSDGTVFVCTANLNASGLTLRFGHADEATVVEEWTRSAKPVAFGVFPDRDHESITRPDKGRANLGNFLIEFLSLSSAEEYAAFSTKCAELTARTLPSHPDRDIYHTYQNLAARVTDDLGHPVRDYFLEFYEHPSKKSDEEKIDRLMIKMHREVLEDVHTYGPDPSCRSLLFDLTDLRKTIAGGKKLMFSLSAAPLSPLISFSAGATNDVGELALHGSQAKTLWRDNQTLIADLIIQRVQAPNVFELQPSG